MQDFDLVFFTCFCYQVEDVASSGAAVPRFFSYVYVGPVGNFLMCHPPLNWFWML